MEEDASSSRTLWLHISRAPPPSVEWPGSEHQDEDAESSHLARYSSLSSVPVAKVITPKPHADVACGFRRGYALSEALD
ncbi:hypothetical protein PUNSTDRAFT_118146 [Punctularia strigosozonata HHB-11173 SS5]|uniref:uncharacterized protein n=1 Tax=Punctularia strigosozonata (strain HHB-11173) TaxID=741275 RepID=UPI0004416B56|nr:uncharacterized protein PUNSTDRAFT_118146 [Punctularia strigosozonata HHB-11173 SS5]EIN12148.1 hypothetical protein PUNSTDRAFT_118146 [Punctularia strigosozonata HHB-11173 SS5]